MGHVSGARRGRIAVVVPTYGEAANVPGLLEQIAGLPEAAELEVLIVDDPSGDGLEDALAKMPPLPMPVELVSRTGARGRGLAGKQGLQLALDRGAELIIEMDADWSHDPRFIPPLIAAAAAADAAFGSRFAQGGEDGERGWLRKTFTRAANAYARVVLGLRLRDPNSGFRCYRRGALEAIGLDRLRSEDCEIIQETAYLMARRGLRIAEVPVVFRQRRHGRTTKTLADVARCFWTTLKLRLCST